MSVEKLWPYIKEIDELNAYFPDLKETEKPERVYMWAVISTLRPDQTRKLIEDARKSRSQQKTYDENELVEVDPEIFKEIQSVLLQKSKQLFFKFTDNASAHKGRTPFLLKKSAKLRRERAKPRICQANYGLLNRRQLQTPQRSDISRAQSRGTYSAPTVEMEEEEKKGG